MTTTINLIAAAIDPHPFNKSSPMDESERRGRRISAGASAKRVMNAIKDAGLGICTLRERQILDSLP